MNLLKSTKKQAKMSWYLGLSLGDRKDGPIVLLGMHDPQKISVLKRDLCQRF